MPGDFTGKMLKGFGPSKKMLKPDVVPSIFSYMPPSKQRKTSEARSAVATHHDIISNLWSACPSDIRHQHNEPEPLTKDVGIHTVWLVLYCNSRLCFIGVYLAI